MTNIPTLPAELTIYNVAELHVTCKSWAQTLDGDCLTLDAQQVAEVDGAGIQLLLSLQNSLHKQQKHLVLSQPSTALANACKALGTASLMAEAIMEGGTP